MDLQTTQYKMSQEEIHFARSLVHPDKAIRDKTVAGVKRFILKQEKNSLNLIDMLKLWKALYYSLWLAESGAQADELADSLTEMISQISKKSEHLVLYVRCLLRTVLREWQLLDQHRINKFYSLMRKAINKIISVFLVLVSDPSVEESKKARKGKEAAIELLTTLQDESLSKIPNGVRFHIADVFIPELVNVLKSEGETSITTDTFLLLVSPFLDILAGRNSSDPVFRERIHKSVFRAFLSLINVEPKLSTIDAKVLQKRVFELAADEATVTECRQRLYDLHKEIAAKTGTAFVGERSEKISGGKKKGANKELNVAVTQKPGDDKVKKTSNQGDISSEVEISEKKEHSAESFGSTKTKRNEGKAKQSTANADSVEVNPVLTMAKQQEKRSPSAPPAHEPVAKKVKVEAQDQEKTAVEKKLDFIASKKFVGSKEGYVFQQV